MTLIASTRIPDGIALAADSVATISTGMKIAARGKTICPSCGKEHEFTAPLALPSQVSGVTSTLSYAQKLQDLWKKFGIGSFGSSFVANRSVFAIIQEFGLQENAGTDGVKGVAQRLGDHIHSHLKKDVDVSTLPENVSVLGFQIVGYEDERPLTVAVNIGRVVAVSDFGGFGATVSGDTVVPQKLWELKGLGPGMEQTYQAWSLQDAADYSEFLIETTSKYQRFSNTIPTVGGEIDIGFVLPGNRFKWLRRKRLASMLMDEEEG